MEDVKPGTELPWRLDVRVGVIQVYGGEERNCLATNAPVVVQKNGAWNEKEGMWLLADGDEQDLAYIVHACNTLPALQAENLEQARLLGLSGSKEAALLAKLDAAERELTRLLRGHK